MEVELILLPSVVHYQNYAGFKEDTWTGTWKEFVDANCEWIGTVPTLPDWLNPSQDPSDADEVLEDMKASLDQGNIHTFPGNTGEIYQLRKVN
jgi:hypothetical protein